jgi:hypothetical protein
VEEAAPTRWYRYSFRPAGEEEDIPARWHSPREAIREAIRETRKDGYKPKRAKPKRAIRANPAACSSFDT